MAGRPATAIIGTCVETGAKRLSDSVNEALARIHERGSTHAITVDRAFRPVGVVSVLDLIEARRPKEAE
jgi:CBS domain-containing protein